MSATSPEDDQNTTGQSSEELRVKDVSEINGITSSINGANDVTAQNGTKRKLPSWMLIANSDNKKEKRSRNNVDGTDAISGCSNEATPSENNSQQCDSSIIKTEKQSAENHGETQNKNSNTADDTDGACEGSNVIAPSENNLQPCDTPTIKTEKEATGDSEVEQQNALINNEDRSSDQNDEPTSSADANVVNNDDNRSDGNIEVKVEPDTDASTSTGICSTRYIKPAVKVEKADATSSSRETCKFGIRCYRQNPMHRIEQAHPGDRDYKRPHYPAPPDGVPDCPYGNLCYRRNPTHFQEYKHPDDTDFKQNYRNYRLRQRKQRQQQQNNSNDDNASDLDDYDLDDPFINDDSDSDYMPSEEEDNTEELDYDDCDKAEE